MPYPEREYLVQELFAVGAVCLLTGASGSGKSHLCYQIAYDLFQGKDIFGFPCNKKIIPAYFCYDRPIEGVYHTLNRMGLDFQGKMELKSFVLEDELRLPTLEEVGGANLIMLDGLDILLPPGKIIDMGSGMGMMRRCQRLAHAAEAGIFGVTGHSKQKGDNSGYVLSREKSIGTTAFGRASDSMIVIEYDPEDSTNDKRVITINVRDDPTQRLKYQFNEQGWLLPMANLITIPLSESAKNLLEVLPADTILTLELIELATSLKKSKIYECLNELQDHKLVVQVSRGKYKKLADKPIIIQ